MFKLNKSGNIWYYTIESFEKTGLLTHCFTTKMGGVSKGYYESLNLRFNCDDSRENVLQNFQIICNEINVNYKDLVLSHQVHEDNIHNVTKEDMGNGIIFDNKFKSADGLICDKPNIPIATFYADCVPLVFLDKKNRVLASSHSGWRGTVKEIGQKTIQKMINEYNSKPEDILCAIGPSIGVCHYEVSDDVAQCFYEKFGDVVLEKHKSKYHVNMQLANEIQMENMGIPKGNITVANICTYCNSDLLFSHRKTNGNRGVLAFIGMLL